MKLRVLCMFLSCVLLLSVFAILQVGAQQSSPKISTSPIELETVDVRAFSLVRFRRDASVVIPVRSQITFAGVINIYENQSSHALACAPPLGLPGSCASRSGCYRVPSLTPLAPLSVAPGFF